MSDDTAAVVGIAYQVTFWATVQHTPKVLWCSSREQAGRVLAQLAGHCDRIEFAVVERMKLDERKGGPIE